MSETKMNITSKRVLAKMNNVRLKTSEETNSNGETTYTVEIPEQDIKITADAAHKAIREAKEAVRQKVIAKGPRIMDVASKG